MCLLLYFLNGTVIKKRTEWGVLGQGSGHGVAGQVDVICWGLYLIVTGPEK
jgi:hypothetical protein